VDAAEVARVGINRERAEAGEELVVAAHVIPVVVGVQDGDELRPSRSRAAMTGAASEGSIATASFELSAATR
jgi:hypothetical protein